MNSKILRTSWPSQTPLNCARTLNLAGKPKPETLFLKILASFEKRFKLLVAFCGVLSTVFPGTATLKCEFFKINLEKHDCRSSLSVISLEGVLQCK